MTHVYGYVRSSTCSQVLDQQLESLTPYRCQEVLIEKKSGTKENRPQLEKLKELVCEGDTIIVERWSRFARSTKDLIALVDYFSAKKVNVISHKENLDTSTPQGKLVVGIFRTFAEFEYDLTVERTREGVMSARENGRIGGRPRIEKKTIEKALRLYETNRYSLKEIKEKTGISAATLYRYRNQPIKMD